MRFIVAESNLSVGKYGWESIFEYENEIKLRSKFLTFQKLFYKIIF